MAAPLIWRFFSRCSFHFLKGEKTHTKKHLPSCAGLGDRSAGRPWPRFPSEKNQVDFGDGSGLQSAGALAATQPKTECGWRVVTDQAGWDFAGRKVERLRSRDDPYVDVNKVDFFQW